MIVGVAAGVLTVGAGVGREVGVAVMKMERGGGHAVRVIAAVGTRGAEVELGVGVEVEEGSTAEMRDKRTTALIFS